jgi:hypothetical protein
MMFFILANRVVFPLFFSLLKFERFIDYEEGYSSKVRRSYDFVRMWQCDYDAFHQEGNEREHMLGLPSLFYRTADHA